MTFTYIQHQFTLFDYNELRPSGRIPIKRITRARYYQSLAELRGGKDRKLRDILSDVNDALERYDQRLTNKQDGSKAVYPRKRDSRQS